MNDPKTQLQDILWNGLQVDIYMAEEAIGLFRKIGEHASAIKAAKYGFDGLFGSIQSTYLSKAVLAVIRLFETPKKGYSIRSVVSALKVLSRHSKVLPMLDKHFVVERLQTFGHPPGTINPLSNEEITRLLIRCYEKSLPTTLPSDTSGLHALKFRRDKMEAHHEIVSPEAMPSITLAQMGGLLKLVQDFIAVIGRGYLGIIYKTSDGNYFLSRDAGDTTRALQRLFLKSGIITHD